MENLTGTYNFDFDTTSPFKCQSPNGYYFASPTIRLFGIPWILQYYPMWKDTNKGEVFLCLTSMPNGVASVKTRRMIKYNETGQVFEEIDTFNQEHMNWGSKRSNMVPQTDMVKFTGSMKIELLELKDSNGNSVYEQYVAKCQSGNSGNTEKTGNSDDNNPMNNSFVLSQESEDNASPDDKGLQISSSGTFEFSFDTKSPFRHESPNGAYFTSPTFRLFGLPWNIDFFPKWKDTNKGDTFLCLTDMPQNVSEIKVRRVKMYKETGQVFEEIDSYTHQHHNRGSKQSNMIKRTDLETLSGSIRIELLEVKDRNGLSLYEQYVAKGQGKQIQIGNVGGDLSGNAAGNPLQTVPVQSLEDKQLMKVMMESLSFQINTIMKHVNQLKQSVVGIEMKLEQIEEKKSDDNSDGLQKQIDDIRKSVSRLQSGGGAKGDSDEEKFKQWLEETMKLGEYYELFVENGIENLTVLQMLGMEELSMIGIKKIGHRLQLSKAIETLKGKTNLSVAAAAPQKQPAEGGQTADI